MGGTSICDQFSEKERFVVRCFGWDFFFLKYGSGKIELLVRALGLWYHVEILNLMTMESYKRVWEREEENGV